MKKRLIINNIYRIAYAIDDTERRPGAEREIKRMVGRLKRATQRQLVFEFIFYLSGTPAPARVIMNRSDVINIEALSVGVK